MRRADADRRGQSAQPGASRTSRAAYDRTFDKAEEKTIGRLRGVSRWTHPFKREVRAKVPIALEAWYVTPLATGDERMSYIEAVKKYPVTPEDKGCGLETFVSGWVHHDEPRQKVKTSAQCGRHLLRSPRRLLHAALRPDHGSTIASTGSSRCRARTTSGTPSSKGRPAGRDTWRSIRRDGPRWADDAGRRRHAFLALPFPGRSHLQLLAIIGLTLAVPLALRLVHGRSADAASRLPYLPVVPRPSFPPVLTRSGSRSCGR